LGKKSIDKDLLATIMGFSGVTDPTYITMIWRKWQRTSKLLTHENDLIRGIKVWSRAVGIEVSPCLFFTKQQIKDFTSGNFNPGDCLALFVSCDRGVSILSCMSMTLMQQEKHKSREAAEGKSTSNHSLTEALQLQSTDPPAPSTHYQEFKLLLGTFAGLLAVLFGTGCDY